MRRTSPLKRTFPATRCMGASLRHLLRIQRRAWGNLRRLHFSSPWTTPMRSFRRRLHSRVVGPGANVLAHHPHGVLPKPLLQPARYRKAQLRQGDPGPRHGPDPVPDGAVRGVEIDRRQLLAALRVVLEGAVAEAVPAVVGIRREAAGDATDVERPEPEVPDEDGDVGSDLGTGCRGMELQPSQMERRPRIECRRRSLERAGPGAVRRAPGSRRRCIGDSWESPGFVCQTGLARACEKGTIWSSSGRLRRNNASGPVKEARMNQ
jgi:hypothetical protein